MAVIDNAGSEVAERASAGSNEIFEEILGAVRSAIADDLWRWYFEHENDEITSIGIWFISLTVRVKHTEPLFRLLFGDPPEDL